MHCASRWVAAVAAVALTALSATAQQQTPMQKALSDQLLSGMDALLACKAETFLLRDQVTQGAGDKAKIESLQSELDERDDMIAGLQWRIQQLEGGEK